MPGKTAEIFVDRVGLIRIFEDAAFAIPDDGAILRVFHGVGGQGKSALCRELFRRTGPDGDPSFGFLRRAEVDLHGRPKDDPDRLLIWIRNGFAKAGVSFAAFDLALAIAWEATRGEQPFPKLENAWLAKSGDALSGIAPDVVQTMREMAEKSVETLPGLGVLISKGSKWVIDKTKTAYLERTRDELKELYRDGELKKPYEVSALLPWMLAQDINHHLARHPEDRLVLFVDEYEGVFDEGGAGARWRENLFDRHMRNFVQESNGLLAVFFSREALPWGADPDWRPALENAQHRLDGLAETDAEDWLKQIPIDGTGIRSAIIEGARQEPMDGAPIYPLLLDLQIEHWRGLTAKNTPITPDLFRVAAESFEGRCGELVECVLRDYGDEMQVTLQRLSVANRFDRAAFEYIVRTFGTGLPLDSFDRIAGLSFITESEDGFLTIHRAVADAIRTTLGDEKYSTSAKALSEHYETRATVASPRDVTDQTISALMEAAYLRREVGLDGYVDWLAKFSAPISMAARYATDEHLWRETLHLVMDELGAKHEDTAAAHNNVAYNLNAQGRYGEAEPLYRKALEIWERVLGADHPSTAASHNNVASNLNAQGRYGEAEPLYRKALEISERVLGVDHPHTKIFRSNLLEFVKKRGA